MQFIRNFRFVDHKELPKNGQNNIKNVKKRANNGQKTTAEALLATRLPWTANFISPQ